jgi:DNA-directed RNA polymerase subunit RPC12/RpoP
MPRRITAEQERIIREELAKKTPREEIARLCRASYKTVSDIAIGKWQPKRRPDDEGIPTHSPLLLVNMVRCPGCGGKVMLPCATCIMRRERDAERAMHGPIPLLPVDREAELKLKVAQVGLDEVCGNCGAGTVETSGRGLNCSNCHSRWSPAPTIDGILEQAIERLKIRVNRKMLT